MLITKVEKHDTFTKSVGTKLQIHANLTDPELYALCKKWGAEALAARRKFIGLLPEVYARRLYERRKFRSIYHFAAALGGIGRRLVDDVLRLEKRFEGMPKLHAALVKGEIGLSKLVRVASVVEIGNEAEVCEKIKSLSKRAVDVLVKEMRGGIEMEVGGDSLFENHLESDSCEKSENRNGSLKPLLSPKSLPGREKQNTSSLNSDYEILNALSPEVKEKLKELIDKKIDINPILLHALAEREAEIALKKAEIGTTPAKSRYVPAQTRKIIIEEFGRKCAHPNCNNPSEQIHHERSYASHHDHDPRDLKPLCRGHHELEHVK